MLWSSYLFTFFCSSIEESMNILFIELRSLHWSKNANFSCFITYNMSESIRQNNVPIKCNWMESVFSGSSWTIELLKDFSHHRLAFIDYFQSHLEKSVWYNFYITFCCKTVENTAPGDRWLLRLIKKLRNVNVLLENMFMFNFRKSNKTNGVLKSFPFPAGKYILVLVRNETFLFCSILELCPIKKW